MLRLAQKTREVAMLWLARGLFATCVWCVCSSIALAQIARDGLLDASYGVDGIATIVAPQGASYSLQRLRGAVLQPDGKLILLGGVRAAGGSMIKPLLVRLTTSGVLDPDFGVGGMAVIDLPSLTLSGNVIAHKAVVLSDGRIVVLGARFTIPEALFDYCTAVFALSAGGALLPTYGPAPGPGCVGFDQAAIQAITEPIGALVLLDQDRLLVSGFSAATSAPLNLAARLTAEGAPDPSFGPGGLRRYGGALFAGGGRKPLFLRAGDFVFAGSASIAGRGVFKATLDLVPAMGFGNEGAASVIWATPTSVLELFSFDLDPVGRTIIAGFARDPFPFGEVICNFCVTRFTSDGAVDASFNPSGALPGSNLINIPGNNSLVVRVLARRDARIVLAGYADHGNGNDTDLLLASLGVDGQTDTRFGDSTTPGFRQIDLGPASTDTRDFTGDAVLQSDGKILVAATSIQSGNFAYAAVRLFDDAVFAAGFE